MVEVDQRAGAVIQAPCQAHVSAGRATLKGVGVLDGRQGRPAHPYASWIDVRGLPELRCLPRSAPGNLEPERAFCLLELVFEFPSQRLGYCPDRIQFLAVFKEVGDPDI